MVPVTLLLRKFNKDLIKILKLFAIALTLNRSNGIVEYV